MRFELSWKLGVSQPDCGDGLFGSFSSLSKKKRVPVYLGLIFNDISLLAEQCHYVSFAYVRTNGNRVTHALP